MHVRLAVAAVLAAAPLAVLPGLPAQATTPTCHGQAATIVGTNGWDVLYGTEGPDVIWAGGGNDRIAAKGGDDVVCGGAGFDTIYAGAGNDLVDGGEQADRVYEGAGDDTMYGGGSADWLVYLGSGATDLHLDARTGTATSSNGTDTFSSFAVYKGTVNADVLIGTGGSEEILGGGGSDRIVALAGDDQIWTEGDDVVVDAGGGNDGVDLRGHRARVTLGYGDDTAIYHLPAAGGAWAGGPGTDLLRVGGPWGRGGYEINLNYRYVENRKDITERWSVQGFEDVSGSFGPDRIIGNWLNNEIRAMGGDDAIFGLDGDDFLWADGGVDLAGGGDGDNTCASAEVIRNCAVYTGP